MKNKHTVAILLAAGCSTRMGAAVTKQMMNICGKSVLSRTLSAFEECELVDAVIVAAREDELEYVKKYIVPEFSKVKNVVCGGKTRAESARLAFSTVPKEATHIAVHDGARCLITPEMISLVISAAHKTGAASGGSYVTDTVKMLSFDGDIQKTIPREQLFLASTPQVFSAELYKKALDFVIDNDKITDDNMLFEAIGISVSAVDLGKENIKITTPDDVEYAEYIISKRENSFMDKIRVGHGYDVHRFAEGRKLVIGGVEIPHNEGLLGHSDADVLIHAVMDALLGAAALGDIGRHFPDSDEKFKGISSLKLLHEVKILLENKGCYVVNIDATLVLQRPKIAAYIDKMISNISETLGIAADMVNIKATTEEKLGFTGSGEGAATHAVALVRKK